MSQSAAGFGVRRQWPLWALAALSIAWLLALLVGGGHLPIEGAGPMIARVGRVTALLPPLVLLLLLAAILPAGRRRMDIDEIEARVAIAAVATGDLEAQLQRIDESLGACVAKVDLLRAAAASDGQGLLATATALEVAAGTMALSSTDLGKAATALQEVIPAVTTQAREAEAALKIAGSEARRHVETVEAALSQVAAHGRDAGLEAEAMVSNMQGLLARIDQASTETTKTIANRAYTLDAAVTGVLDRSAEAFASIGETLTAQARSVEQMVATARAELDGLGTEGTRAIGQRLDVLLGAANQLKAQFAEQMQLSDQLRQRAADSMSEIGARLETLRGAQADASAAMLTQADETARQFEQRLVAMGERQQVADQEQQMRLSANLAALEGQLSELRDRQSASAMQMQQILGEAVAQVESRLETLKARQLELGADMEAETARMVAGVELRLGELRNRHRELAADMAAETAAGLDTVGGRFVELGARAAQSHAETAEILGRTMAAIGGLGEALDSRQATLGALEQRIEGLRPAFDGFASDADARLPLLVGSLDALSDRTGSVASQLDRLADRIEGQVALLRDSSAAFERDHGAVVSLAKTLAGEFETARGLIGEIHGTTEQTAIAAAARMVENVIQVRAAVNATAAEIQSLLSSVVAEAQHALDDFATNKAEAAFGAPIRLQIASLEDASVKAADAAAQASERLTTRLLDLMRVISETEARVDEVDTRMDIRARDTLAARSIRLVESLNAASVDVARLLAVDMGESAWKRYLDGDRSLFARTTVRLADKDSARKIARHYQHDDDFREEASRYLDQFQQLIRRVLKDPDGESFALVLLSSDIGKLYVMIAEALGRPVARKPE